MVNPTEAEEKNYLSQVQAKLQAALEQIVRQVDSYSQEILEIKRYMYENRAQLDSAERAANRIAVSDGVMFGEQAVRERQRLQKLIQSPYFGRIDFREGKKAAEQVFYIGVHSFIDPITNQPVIFDWRAPVSSIFYDFELGEAFYMAPVGKVEGTLIRKRQYSIRQKQMDYMLESSLNIGDTILQKELSQASDEKMKNIVATIQREQNAIIRNEAARVLIIQGAAGSGKTSIALHRVAFLLYRYKDTLTSNNVAIISPNKVFGNYISNVLPELGEENILELSFEAIAAAVLGPKYKRQTFPQQVESLLADENPHAIERISFKATNDFVAQLQAYLEAAEQAYFTPTPLAFEDFYVSGEELLSSYQALKRLPIKNRLRKIADNLLEKYKRDYEKRPSPALSRQVRGSIQKMFRFSDPFSLYKNFYRCIGREALLQTAQKNLLEFCDVYPLVYVKLFFEESQQDYQKIQHLLVDEMQDYTPIQYAVLSKLFCCKMTILGDSCQSVNPYSSSSAEKIQPYFAGCATAELCKSYRSTVEITTLTQKILENKRLIPIQRHGDKPTITVCQTQGEEMEKIQSLIGDYRKSAYASLGIICKSQDQANTLFAQLHPLYDDISLLDFHSDLFREGIVITSVHMSKGLEFDQVIVPDASHHLYKTQLERSLLYIACTRAMHKLDLVCRGKASAFLD